MHYQRSCSHNGYRKFNGNAHFRRKRCDDRRGGAGFAVLLIGTGVLFLLNHLDMLGGYRVVQFWPLLLVWPAISCLVRARSWYGRVFALLLFIFADLALANSLALFVVPWGVIWPVAVVAAGVLMMAYVVLSPTRTLKFELPEQFEGNADILQTRIVCGGNEEDFGTGVFRGGVVDVFMGGYELDLRAAQMEADSVELFVKLKLAGVKIRVPQEWKVTIDGETFMGEIEDNTSKPTEESAKELKIRALVRQGALEIEN